jgi:hemolysin activation/secretion protein
VHLAPESLGSLENAAILAWSLAEGMRIGDASFIRGEGTLSTRAEESEHFENTVLSFELKGYSVLGPVFFGDFYLGKHTLASNFYIDYGQALDGEREFLLGGDNALRGYDARTFSGDKRVVLNIEDRAHLVENIYDLVSVGAAAFIDVGGASFEPFQDLVQDELYGNVGAGLRLAFPKSSGERVLRFDVAVPVRDGPDGSKAWEPRFLVSGGQLFGSYTRSERVGAERASLELGFDR